MNYCNTISGETQTKQEWLEEIASEGYHLKDDRDEHPTPLEYFEECVETGGLFKVD